MVRRRFEASRRTEAVHNERMNPLSRSFVRPVVLLAAASLALTGCGGGSESPAAKATTLPDASQQTEVPVPSGVTLTPYGTELAFGKTATVAYKPNDQRASVLELTVKSATQGKISDLAGYSLEERTKQSTPYYVKVSVKNVGDGDVGRTPIPLYLVDNRTPATLINASSFTNTFTKCPSTALPTTFAPQASRDACLVYLVPDHGTMVGVSFRAVQEYAPILWTGKIGAPAKKKSS